MTGRERGKDGATTVLRRRSSRPLTSMFVVALNLFSIPRTPIFHVARGAFTRVSTGVLPAGAKEKVEPNGDTACVGEDLKVGKMLGAMIQNNAVAELTIPGQLK